MSTYFGMAVIFLCFGQLHCAVGIIFVGFLLKLAGAT